MAPLRQPAPSDQSIATGGPGATTAAPGPPPPRSDPRAARRAALRLLLSSALFAVMAAGAKLVSRRLPGPEVALVRFVTGVVVVGIVVASGRGHVRPRRWGWLASRGVFGGLSVVTYFASIKAVPVGVATLLNQTQPVYTMLFSWLLLGERPRRHALTALGLTLTGVAVIVGVRHLAFHAWRGEALGVLSAIGSGIAVTSIRASRREARAGTDDPPPETALSVFFSFTLFGALLSLPFALPPLGAWVSPTPHEWGLLAGVGVVSVGAQLIMTEALRHMTGVQSGIISQLTVPMAVALGTAFLGERITASFVGGAALILSGVAMTVAATAPKPDARGAARPPDPVDE